MTRNRGLTAGVIILAILAGSAGLDVCAVAVGNTYRDGWGYVDPTDFRAVVFRVGSSALLLAFYAFAIFRTMTRRRLPLLMISIHAIAYTPIGLLLCVPFFQIFGIFSPVNFPMLFVIRNFGSYLPIAILGLSLAGLSAALLGIAISTKIPKQISSS